MKNILKQFSEALQENTSDEMRINNMMSNIFNEKTTHQSIELFDAFKSRYEQELKQRNLNALIENSDIDAYFNKTKDIEVINPQIYGNNSY